MPLMYRSFFKLVLQRMDAERAHALAKRSLRIVRATAVGRALVRRLAGRPDQCLETHTLGLTFPSPLGVAAGVDKEADWFDDLSALGFGFVEVGTITAEPQAGNPPPRVVRLAEDRAILNRLGFPNPGAEVAAARLACRRRETAAPPGGRHGETAAAPAGRHRDDATHPPGGASVVGVNIGKSKAIALEAAGGDYIASVRRLAPVCDYLVLNVSSPNTPGLRELQDVERLRGLVGDVRQELARSERAVPLLIKLDPDLADEQITAIVTLAIELHLDGIVAVNTTIDRRGLGDRAEIPAAFEGGGVSGAPLGARATEVLRLIRRTAGDNLVVMSVGGVQSAEDVWERILAGASLVQVYTAFVYDGPSWPKRVNRELARRVRQAGASSIQDLIGAAGRTPEQCGVSSTCVE